MTFKLRPRLVYEIIRLDDEGNERWIEETLFGAIYPMLDLQLDSVKECRKVVLEAIEECVIKGLGIVDERTIKEGD